MVNDNFPYESNSHLALSYQLLSLLKWLVENDNGTLKMIMEDALQQGALENFKKCNFHNEDPQAILDMQDTIIDFFGLLETYLQETIIDKNPHKNPKQLLYETLLEQWEPTAETTQN